MSGAAKCKMSNLESIMHNTKCSTYCCSLCIQNSFCLFYYIFMLYFVIILVLSYQSINLALSKSKLLLLCNLVTLLLRKINIYGHLSAFAVCHSVMANLRRLIVIFIQCNQMKCKFVTRSKILPFLKYIFTVNFNAA